jgi:hypothetical protein
MRRIKQARTKTSVSESNPGSKSVFLSYSNHDRHFVPLLKELLKLHGHEPYYAPDDIPVGAEFFAEIEEAIAQSDVMIVVVSRHSRSSKWVTKEVSSFQALNHDAPVIPIMLEPTDLNEVVPGLDKYQAIDFGQCLLTGFQKVFASLGNDFLSAKELRERRGGGDRREGTRRGERERRRSGIVQRLQVGFLLSYSRETGHDGFEKFDVTPQTRVVLIGALEPEALRYEYRDRATGDKCDPRQVLSNAIARVWDDLPRDVDPEGTVIFKAVAEHICKSYDASMIDRRTEERRQDSDRRDGSR